VNLMNLPYQVKKILNSELTAMMTIMGLCNMTMAVINPVMPLYLTDIGVSPITIGLMFSLAMTGMVLGESTGGWISDRTNIKVPFSITTFVCVPIILSFTISQNTTVIFLIFLFWGIFRATVYGPARGYVGTHAPLGNKATFMGIYAATMALSRSLGSLASGIIADHLGYDWNFYIGAGISALAGLLVMVTLHRTPVVPSEQPSATVTVNNPASPAESFYNRSFIVQCVVAGLVFLAIGGTSLLSLVVTEVLGRQATDAGILFTVGGIANMLFLVPLGRLADRRSKRLLMIMGLAISVIGMAGYASARSFAWLLGAAVINSLGQAMFSPAAVAYLSDVLPARRQSTAMGVYGACEDIGVIAGSAMSGVVWTACGHAAPFVIGAAACGIGSLICLIFLRKPQARSLADI
jgi:MFS family permease